MSDADIVVLYRTDEDTIRERIRETAARRLADKEAERQRELDRMAERTIELNEATIARRNLVADLVLLWAQRPSRWRIVAHWRWSRRLAKALNTLTWHKLSEVSP